ncbi:MAG: hypothetical protein ACR2GR_10805, partial [Rhodothermales bacterium]
MIIRLPRTVCCRLVWSVSLAVVCLLGGVACGEAAQEVVEERTMLTVGDSEVAVVMHQAETSGLTYLNLHDDENTGVEAALSVIRQHGGRVIELQHGGERNVTFSLEDTSYTFDPNRMFTDRGAGLTLADLGDSSQAATSAVRAFAEALLEEIGLDTVETIITLHNNTDERYSA